MYRIRFHGRGGQGMKTAGRLLGTALHLEGFEVQDAPRYGAERRGAPILSSVRAATGPIHERGPIRRPDLVVVADETLVAVPAAGVSSGLDAHSVLLVSSDVAADEWRVRLAFDGLVLTIAVASVERDPLERRYAGARCAGAAARLLGVVSRANVEAAIEAEIGALGAGAVARDLEAALAGFEAMDAHAGRVAEGREANALDYERPAWIDLPFDDARVSAPAIHGALTSVEVRTGLWRTMRPVLVPDRCQRCWWVCSSLCPDSAIAVGGDGRPVIDYEHCKGCMICVAQCPAHAIEVHPEATAQVAGEGGA